MWLRLDDDERLIVIEGLKQLPGDDVGRLLERLTAEPDPDDDAFRNAVDTDDELEVDPDAVVSRGEEGAFVMSWTWVSNGEAGFGLAAENVP